jgi:DNA repair exonuclease SbcCD ATPase subunit
VQELVDGIDDLLTDLNEELVNLDFDFGVRTNEHNSLVIQLDQDIQDAEIDIQRTDDTVENLLKPRRSQLKGKISQIQEYQAENRKNLDEATLLRNQEHEEFENLVSELNGATAAVDDALALLSNLGNPSLVQIKKFHVSLKKIEAKIKPHSEHAALIKALITLASEQNFSDQDVLRQIVQKLNEFRSSVVDALNDATAREQEEQEDYEEHVDQLNAEYAGFQRSINNANIDLTAVQGITSSPFLP